MTWVWEPQFQSIGLQHDFRNPTFKYTIILQFDNGVDKDTEGWVQWPATLLSWCTRPKHLFTFLFTFRPHCCSLTHFPCNFLLPFWFSDVHFRHRKGLKQKKKNLKYIPQYFMIFFIIFFLLFCWAEVGNYFEITEQEQENNEENHIYR